MFDGVGSSVLLFPVCDGANGCTAWIALFIFYPAASPPPPPQHLSPDGNPEFFSVYIL